MKVKNFAQWKTTILGLIILVASIASVFIKEIGWSDAVIGIGIGLVLIFSPDTIIDKLNNFIKILLLVLVTGCMSQKKLAKVCADNFPVKDSTVIVERIDTVIEYIKGDSIRVPFYVDGGIIYKDTICPPVKVRTVFKTKEKEVYIENTAKTTQLQNEIDDLNKSIIKEREKLKNAETENKELAGFKRQVFFGFGIFILSIILYIFSKFKRLW